VGEKQKSGFGIQDSGDKLSGRSNAELRIVNCWLPSTFWSL
jgi:hypothetical protein